jgi:hypothetical protein
MRAPEAKAVKEAVTGTGGLTLRFQLPNQVWCLAKHGTHGMGQIFRRGIYGELEA